MLGASPVCTRSAHALKLRVSLLHGFSLLQMRVEVVTRCGGAHFNPSTWEVEGGGAGGAGRPVLLLVSLRPT